MAEVQRDTIGSREDTILFLHLVNMFSSQAMIGLGKVINPATGKTGKNLEMARFMIDLLEMIEHKTQGNLNADETRTMRATLTDLRLMFVEESKSNPSTATEPATPPQSKPADEPPSSEDKVKFHKKYD